MSWNDTFRTLHTLKPLPQQTADPELSPSPVRKALSAKQHWTRPGMRAGSGPTLVCVNFYAVPSSQHPGNKLRSAFWSGFVFETVKGLVIYSQNTYIP